MIIVPDTEEQLKNFCYWIDIIQPDPITFSAFKKYEDAENKNFVFWFLDSQLIMVNNEFPFPKNEVFVSIELFEKILKINKKKYSHLIV